MQSKIDFTPFSCCIRTALVITNKENKINNHYLDKENDLYALQNQDDLCTTDKLMMFTNHSYRQINAA